MIIWLSEKNNLRLSAGIATVLILSLAFSGWIVVRADREMRAALIQSARLTAQTVNTDLIKILTGTEADSANPGYLQLKKQLAAGQTATPECRFTYLMGRRADGTVFFFADNEPPGSADYSPPGQIYSEVPEEYRRVFDTRTEAVEGPVTDRWGSWVSALVPITDSQTGALLAVMGMDIDARSWSWDVAGKAAFPIGLMLILLLAAALVIIEAGNTSAFTSRSARRNQIASWLVLAAGLIMVTLSTLHMKTGIERNAEHNFVVQCDEIKNKITDRLGAHARILQGGAAFFNADETVTREEWRIYTRLQKIGQQLPGIQGIGFSLLIPRAELARHIQEIRSEGFPEYKVFPDGDRALYSSIIYLEPFSSRNLRSFGYDMFSEPVRRAAMEQARDEDAAILSGKVTLVQETGEDVQAGTLMYVPVYRNGMPVDSVEQRRAALYGWVYSPYRMNDLFRGIFGGRNLEKEQQIRLQVFDGVKISPQTLLYTSQSAAENTDHWSKKHFARQIPVNFNGHSWTLCFTRLSGGFFTGQYTLVWLTLIGGTCITLLLFALLRVLLNTRAKAERMAEELTDELRESEERWKFALEGAGAGVWDWDVPAGKVMFSRHWKEMLGYAENEIGSGLEEWSSRVHPEDLPQATADVKAHLDGQTAYYVSEHRIRCKDGSWKWILDQGMVTKRDAGENPLRMIGTHTDITARKQAEESLRQLTDRLTLAARAGGVGIWDYDVVSNRLVWDDQMYRLYGITADQFGGAYEAWQAGVHPDDRQRGDEEIKTALRGGRDFNTEFRVLWPDGTVHNIRALALVQRDASGQPLRMIGTNWDITAQKQAEAALRDSKDQINLLLQSTDQGIYGIDLNGCCTFINQAGLTILGCRLEDCLGQNMHDLIHHSRSDGSHYPAEDCPIFRAKRTGKGSRIDSEVFWKKDGTSFPAEYSSYPILKDGKTFGAVVAFSDITGRKQTEKALIETNYRLEAATAWATDLAAKADAANIAKSGFLANMSHEIRTPMNAVIGMTDLMLETGLNPKQREFANIIRLSGKALLSLIDDILDFSKIEAGRMVIDAHDFNLIQCVEETLDMMIVKASEKNIELTCSVASDVPAVVRGDAARLRQILLNLLSNALKFTHQGEVGISVSCQPSGEGYRLTFSVHDTGIGIEQDKIGRIFEAFTQADTSMTRQYGGTGLGLTISRRLSELMGGRMWAESTPGKGSVFHFTIQAAAPARHAKTVQADQTPFTVDLRDVLIVDDNLTNLKILTAQLTRWGLVPVAFNTPEAALQSIREGRPYALMITDMQMPVMDGMMLVKEVRKYRSMNELPIIMLTSVGTGEKDELPGLSSYLVKPVKSGVLYQNIAGILRGEAGNCAEVISAANTKAAASLLNLLIVEDNKFNQTVALLMLSHLGYTADLACDGIEALERIDAKSYDIILMDIQMPRMDGRTATKEIRSRLAGKKQPLIVGLTAHASVEERNVSIAAGMDEYLTKPLQMEKLREFLLSLQNRTQSDRNA